MQFRQVLIGASALGAAAAAVSAALVLHPFNLRHGAQAVAGHAQLHVYGGRSAQQRLDPHAAKLDGTLADVSRHLTRVRPERAVEDLRSLSPAARFVQRSSGETPRIAIDATTRGDPQALKAALVSLGLEGAALYKNSVGGWLPVDQIEAASARSELVLMRAALPRTRAAVATQGDFVQRSSAARASLPNLTGAGVTVGVVSDSFACFDVYEQPGSGVPASGFSGYASNGFTASYATDQSTGALPAGVNVVKEANCLNYGAPLQPPFSDEGRAMLQIVHVVAPGAGLSFYGPATETDMAAGILALQASGANVIADDLSFADDPFYQDGIISQAIDVVAAKGAAYFSAGGNDADASYENLAPVFTTRSTIPNTSGEVLLNFDTSNATNTTSLPVTLAPLDPGQFDQIAVQWDQPYVTGAPNSGGATSQIDLCVSGTASGQNIYDNNNNDITNNDGTGVTCTGVNPVGGDPVQVLVLANPANAASATPTQNVQVSIGLKGTVKPGRLIVLVDTDGQTSPAPISTFATHSATLHGHSAAKGGAALGAAFYYQTPECGTTPAVLEDFSSEGGAPILFDANGKPLPAPEVRQKPDFVGPDGANDTFLGFTITGTTSIVGCQNDASYPNFFGTSAATPHAAGIAALMLQANSTLTGPQIYTALQNTALPMTGSGATPNFYSGYGFIQADAAIATLSPGPPSLKLGAASIAVGSSTTLTWTSPVATSCTASGTWSGALAASGSQTLTPTAAGSYPYSLTCANSLGTSAAASVTLTVTAAPSGGGGGGGGGALGGWTLWGLAGLAFALTRRRRS
jgi:hypothetical protein